MALPPGNLCRVSQVWSLLSKKQGLCSSLWCWEELQGPGKVSRKVSQGERPHRCWLSSSPLWPKQSSVGGRTKRSERQAPRSFPTVTPKLCSSLPPLLFLRELGMNLLSAKNGSSCWPLVCDLSLVIRQHLGTRDRPGSLAVSTATQSRVPAHRVCVQAVVGQGGLEGPRLALCPPVCVRAPHSGDSWQGQAGLMHSVWHLQLSQGTAPPVFRGGRQSVD